MSEHGRDPHTYDPDQGQYDDPEDDSEAERQALAKYDTTADANGKGDVPDPDSDFPKVPQMSWRPIEYCATGELRSRTDVG
eukprot:1033959-Pyramimonas_sp.AAC.3